MSEQPPKPPQPSLPPEGQQEPPHPPQFGQHQPPQRPQYGQYQPPQPPQFGQQQPPQPPQFGQYQPPQYGQPTQPNSPEQNWQQYPGQSMPSPQQPIQPAPLPPDQQRTWGMLSHLIPLIVMVFSAGFLGFIGSLIIYLLYRDRGDFVRRHSANSLNVQIITAIIALVSVPLVFVLIGFFTFGAVFIWAVIMHIIGAVKANNGELWDPPLTPRMIR